MAKKKTVKKAAKKKPVKKTTTNKPIKSTVAVVRKDGKKNADPVEIEHTKKPQDGMITNNADPANYRVIKREKRV